MTAAAFDGDDRAKSSRTDDAFGIGTHSILVPYWFI
jgi:hypothetical protein